MVYKKAMRTRIFAFISGMALILTFPVLGMAASDQLVLTAGDPLGIALIAAGALLVIAEIFIISHGLLAFMGALFFLIGSVFVIQTANPALRLLWINFLASGLFTIAGVTAIMLYALKVYRQSISHTFSLVGQKALVIAWDDTRQRVEVDGSFWNAQSLSNKHYTHGEWTTVHAQDNLTLYIE